MFVKFIKFIKFIKKKIYKVNYSLKNYIKKNPYEIPIHI